MALLLKKTDDFGTNEGANYWKIVEIKSDYFVNKTKTVLAGWTNENCRRSGKQPIKRTNLILDDVDLTRELIYKKVIKLSVWSQAKEC